MEDVPLCIAQGQAKNVEPTVRVISAAVAALNVIRSAFLVRLHLRRRGALNVVLDHEDQRRHQKHYE